MTPARLPNGEKMRPPPLAALAVIVGVLPAFALQPPAAPEVVAAPRGYVCLRAATPPKVDGRLDDEAWKLAPWTEDFVDIEGAKKPKPRHRTRVKMLWDAEALYVAAEITEPHVWATIDRHDAVIFQDPDFEVFVDPDGDGHLYAELELNARNTTWDLLLTKPYKDGGKAVNAWEIAGLKTAVAVQGTLNDPRDTDTGWTVEVAWPWAGLRELADGAPGQLGPRDGESYRVNFSRVEWDTEVVAGNYVKVKGRPEHNWVWSPQGVIDMHRPERWGRVQFRTAPGTAYTPDIDQRVKDRLHEVYYAQRAYREKHSRYARTAAELGLQGAPQADVAIEATRNTFEATLKPWTIAHDSRLRRE